MLKSLQQTAHGDYQIELPRAIVGVSALLCRKRRIAFRTCLKRCNPEVPCGIVHMIPSMQNVRGATDASE